MPRGFERLTHDAPTEILARRYWFSHNETNREKTMALLATVLERSGERLSSLQRQILRMAYDRVNEPLYYSEALEELYGFPPAVGG